MTTLADKSLLSGGDNKPPMLEKHLYDSWKSRMEIYMMNRPHGRMILASVEKGPLVWSTITVDGVTRPKEYTKLTPAETIQVDGDIKAINIILQGLPTKIYALVSQYRVAKDIREKVLVITALEDDLRKLKGKAIVDNDVTKHPSDPEMLKIDVEQITPKLYAKLVQELLTNISNTCPSINNADEKLVAVTPKNKDKSVRFTKPVTSSGNTITKTTSTSNLVSNNLMLSSAGVKQSTSASGSQPLGNTKKDKIRQTPSSTQKNKVEAHPRKVKSTLKNKDYVVEPKGTALVQHSKLNANSDH
ncbi:hypothetical protein Tco_0996226 [Tanacetum coccineum]